MRILKRVWCRLFHQRTDRNISYAWGSEWRCRRCGCRFLVPWAIPLDHVSRPLHVQLAEMAQQQAAELAHDEPREFASVSSS